MRNFSNKNHSNKKNKKLKKNLEYDNNSKSSNFPEENNLLKNKNNARRRFIDNKNENIKLNKKNNRGDSSSSPKNSNFLNKSNNEFHNNLKNNNQKFANKNFDDWIWGKHSGYEALTSERAINRIWCTSDIYSTDKFYLLLKDLKSKGVLIEEVSWNRLSQLTFGGTHQGIAIQLAYSKTIPLEKLIDLSNRNSTNPIILALDGITDPHNLGAIIRSAEAFNCKGIIIPQRRSAGLTGTVAKVAAGALEHIPVSRVVNLNRAIEELKKMGYLAIGLSGDGRIPISKFDEKAPLVVIIGAEDKGLSLLTQKKCDYILRIPLKGKTNSLNASVAAAISIFYLSNN